MRLWSLHPRYLDAAGLTACWREGLLARAVVAGQTVGYRNHPQLVRFRACPDPVAAVDTYLAAILAEARSRGYRFDASKIGPCDSGLKIAVSDGQLAYELRHLKEKLNRRSPGRCAVLSDLQVAEPHPIFTVMPGDVEQWEIIR